MNNYCNDCGEIIETDLPWEMVQRLRELCLCYSCNFWTAIEQNPEDPDVVIIEGLCYIVGPDDPTIPRVKRGLMGQRYEILFTDGRIIETTNLQPSGEIPEHFVERIPDNTIYLKKV